MSLGALPLIAAERPGNLVHIVLDNEVYESTGAQPSISSKVDLGEVAKSCGYARVARVDGAEDLDQALLACVPGDGPFLILVKAGIAPVEGIPRVAHSPWTFATGSRASSREKSEATPAPLYRNDPRKYLVRRAVP